MADVLGIASLFCFFTFLIGQWVYFAKYARFIGGTLLEFFLCFVQQSVNILFQYCPQPIFHPVPILAYEFI